MIIHGDCLEVLRSMEPCSVDAVVTDPPYGISFMAKKWDYDVPSIDVWRECLRVLKPGGHMLVACGTRTQHRMVTPIEDAGFEIRDVITWLYSQGFPKSLDVSKAIDKEAGATREVVGQRDRYHDGIARQNLGDCAKLYNSGMSANGVAAITAPATDAAKQWEGFGTALKPAVEFWTLCRKPLSESTVAKNVLKHGTGAINVDGCRVAFQSEADREGAKTGFKGGISSGSEVSDGWKRPAHANYVPSVSSTEGRFPANLILDEEAAAALDAQTGHLHGAGFANTLKQTQTKGNIFTNSNDVTRFGDSGGASRFFYQAKSSKSDRGAGNNHPTCKPTTLMAYLCKLITPPGGIVLDPFAGSGSTGVGALREGFRFVGIEREAEYVAIAKQRVEAAS